jgi:hypothetical protein
MYAIRMPSRAIIHAAAAKITVKNLNDPRIMPRINPKAKMIVPLISFFLVNRVASFHFLLSLKRITTTPVIAMYASSVRSGENSMPAQKQMHAKIIKVKNRALTAEFMINIPLLNVI